MSSPPPGLVGIPAVSWLYTECANAIVGVSHQLPRGSELRWERGCSTIEGKRERIAEMSLSKDRWRWAFFLDSDIVVPDDVVLSLLQVDADVVGAVYRMRNPPYEIEAGLVVEQPEQVDPMAPADHPDVTVQFLSLEDASQQQSVGVDVMGFGCTLVHRRVFEALERPWFRAFRTRKTDYGQGEDFNFTWRARRAGFQVACHTGLRAEHMTTVPMRVDPQT